MDMLLAKAKPINKGGSASGITDLRRGKATGQKQLQPETEARIWRETVLQMLISAKKERKEVLQVPEHRMNEEISSWSRCGVGGQMDELEVESETIGVKSKGKF
ncbi:hypothetical protein WISP_118281 [Willisornis vidua]|uniref:Uncharacterized protein n=1 Tax=Willisornis vidua TaxID=1566151 RepID=A0ABQ9CZL6_9PASS|nr:hypothetical protein WISP_118281 [Willisornis vidua]